jgi:hypothetical protein
MLVIAGRQVSVHAPNSAGASFTAQWRTRRAHYAFVADGAKGMDTIKRFVACLP